MSPKCSLLVVYNGPSARDEAVSYCDSLVARFWPDFNFQVSWCDWADLNDPSRAEEADLKAGKAEFIVIASALSQALPDHLKTWLELALHDRADREGVLVGLPGLAISGDQPGTETALTQLYLRKLAHECGMDFLNAVPQSLALGAPESHESYNARATQMTSVLDRILHEPAMPPRMLH